MINKKVNTFLVMATLCLLTGCAHEFDLENVTASEKPVLYCIPTPGQEVVVIQFSKSVPSSKAESPVMGIPGARIRFEVNGTEEHVYWNEDSTETLPAQCYYVRHRLTAGDRINIRAEADGLPTASSETEVPESFPLKNLKLVEKPGTEAKLQLRITFEDPAETDDFYGIRIVKEENGEICEVSPETEDEPLLNNKIGLDAGFDFDNSYYRNLYIWTDELISGQEYTLRLNIPAEGKDDNDKTSGRKPRFKVGLYRLSPDLYRFLKSLNDNSNNNLGEIGLAPLRSNYTNVQNGFGVVGGCNLTENDRIGDFITY